MLSCQMVCNYVPRLGLPIIVPFIVKDMAFSAGEAASLLSAFFPGYVLTQIPLGFLAQLWGAKIVLTLNMVGSAAMLLALPAAVRFGAKGVFACLFTLGLFQGPFVPAQSLMKRSWVPSGPEKPMALLLIGIGSKVSRMAAASITPVLCATLGWRKACSVYGIFVAAFTVLWQAFARNQPSSAAAPVADASAPGKKLEAKVEVAKKKEKTFEPRVFSVAGIQACIWVHVAANNTEYTLMQWAPSCEGCAPTPPPD